LSDTLVQHRGERLRRQIRHGRHAARTSMLAIVPDCAAVCCFLELAATLVSPAAPART